MYSDLIKSTFNKTDEKVVFLISPKNTIVKFDYSPNRPISLGDVNHDSLITLKHISDRSDCIIILQDSDIYEDTLFSIVKFLRSNDIKVDLFSTESEYIDYDILISHKSGFNDFDWRIIYDTLVKIPVNHINLTYIDYDDSILLSLIESNFIKFELDQKIRYNINDINFYINEIIKNNILTKLDIDRFFVHNTKIHRLINQNI